MARNRLSQSRRNKRYSEIDFRLPEALLRLDWSHELIYQHIWNDKVLGGALWKHLRQSTKQRRKRYNSKDSLGQDGWPQNILLPKGLQNLSTEKSLATGKLIPSWVAEPSTVS